jgi:hypothetical protein
MCGEPGRQAEDEAAADIDDHGAEREVAAGPAMNDLVHEVAQQRTEPGGKTNRHADH